MEPMRRRSDAAERTHEVEVTDDFLLGISLVPRHDNHACTLCLTMCLVLWLLLACGLAIAFALVVPQEPCGVACRVDRSTEHFSCAWLFRRRCFNGIDDGTCRGCPAPEGAASLDAMSFATCCPLHPK